MSVHTDHEHTDQLPPTAFPVGATLLTALGAVPIAIFPGFLYGLYATSVGILPRHMTLTQIPVRTLLLSQLVSYAPLIAYLLFTVPRLAQRPLSELGVRALGKRDVLTALTGTALMVVLVAVSSSLLTSLTHQHTVEAAVMLLRELHTPAQIAAFISIAVIFAPMVEEFAFRLFLFNAISKHTSRITGAIASSLVFGYVHSTDVTVALPLACGGLILAWVYMKTGCYWANVTTHACFNAVSVVAVLVFHVTD